MAEERSGIKLDNCELPLRPFASLTAIHFREFWQYRELIYFFVKNRFARRLAGFDTASPTQPKSLGLRWRCIKV